MSRTRDVNRAGADFVSHGSAARDAVRHRAYGRVGDGSGRRRHRRRVRRVERGRPADAAARACSCSKRERGWAGGPPRSPIPRPASWSTTASTFCSAATARRSRFSATSARSITSALQPQLSVAMIDRAGPALAPRLSPAPGAVAPAGRHPRMGRAAWADRLSALRMAAPLKLGVRRLRRRRRGAGAGIGRGAGEVVAARSRRRRAKRSKAGCVRYGQTERLREMLWRPLALAALNQPADRAAAPPFARVLAEMFGRDPRAAAIVLPTSRWI